MFTFLREIDRLVDDSRDCTPALLTRQTNESASTFLVHALTVQSCVYFTPLYNLPTQIMPKNFILIKVFLTQ